MAFTNYQNISMVLEKFKIKYRESDFVEVNEVEVSPYFLDDLNFSRDHVDVRASEYAICENIVYPIIKEIYKKHVDCFSLWSHKFISYNEDLSGIPDYLLATQSELGRVVLGKPLVMLAEAKKNDFEAGWGQCLAEMVAAQKINDDFSFAVYGIVTDGNVWKFGKLVTDEFTENRTLFTIDNLGQLFGAIDFVLETLRKQISER